MTTLAAENAIIAGVIEAMRDFTTAVYERDDLPSVVPPAYSEIEVTRENAGTSRSGGPGSLFGVYLLTERTAGKHMAALRDHRDATAAIEGVSVLVDGVESTPVAFDGADPIAPNGGWYVGFRTWRFALFPSA